MNDNHGNKEGIEENRWNLKEEREVEGREERIAVRVGRFEEWKKSEG